MKKTFLTTIALIGCLFTQLQAQTEYLVFLHTGQQMWAENARDYADEAFISAQETIDGHYYRLLQFYEIPAPKTLDQLQASGIQLLEYLPNKAYVAAIPVEWDVQKLPDFGVRSIMPIVPSLKMALTLQTDALPAWAVDRNEIQLVLKYYKNLSHDAVLNYCERDGIQVLLDNKVNNFLKIRIPKDRITAVAALPYVAFLDPIPEPSKPDDTEARSLHRVNMLDTQFPGGRHYTGDGVSILVRDDGDIGPHIDFQGRLNSDFVGGFGGTHGDGVAGIMGGAGNLNPKNRGMAAGATLYATDYEETFLDETMTLFFEHNVLVTNSSYSNGCNAGYTSTTETVDDQVYSNPTLLHVFSAGNSNNNDCGYGAGNQWGNITGGHKQGKNVIATANVYNDASLVGSSSHGPAHDGRIKPDIAANGQDQISTDPDNSYSPFGGTSGASPGIVGTAAVLHQAYRELNGGATAESALLKAVLLNTANDLGRPGPDFEFGWGHVNAWRAVRTLEEERYFKAHIMAGDTNTHVITIPTGVVQARVMVYWADPAASVMTSKALVNDLDIQMTDAAGTIYQPWWLDPTPDPNILSQPAAKGEDHLNNMEQVAIDHPAAGDYTLEVRGTELPFGAHDYFVVWEFRTNEITVIYPVGGESLAPGEAERINWDAEGNDDLFSLFYSTDDGATWVFIAAVPGDQRQYEWVVPDALTGNALVRIDRNGQSDQSDGTFSIAPVPQNVEITQVCPDYVRLTWDSVAQATSYTVFMLGDKYMDEVGNTDQTFYDVPIASPLVPNWFAVRMNNEDANAIGRRTVAIPWESGLFNCQLNQDVSLDQINSPSAGAVSGCNSVENNISVTVTNTGVEDLPVVEVAFQVNGQPAIVETLPDTLHAGMTVAYEFVEPFVATQSGDYTIKTWAGIPGGDDAAFNDTVSIDLNLSIYPGTGEPVVYLEDFENHPFLPDFYSINNPDGDITWDTTTVIGADNNPTTCLWVNTYFYSDQGQQDELTTIPLDLSTAEFPVLRFDVASARFNDAFFDRLVILVSTDCGTTFDEVVYDKSNSELATVSDQTNNWEPSAADEWRRETVNLTAFAGNSVVLRFVLVNGYGSNLFLDNINVDFMAEPFAQFSAPPIFCAGEPIQFENLSTGDLLNFEWNFGATANPATSTLANPTTTFSAGGMYSVTLTASNDAGSNSVEMDLEILPQPVADFSYVLSGGSIELTNNSTNATDFLWDFGDGSTSTEPSPIYAYSEVGQYTVTLTATNDCGSVQSTQTVDIVVGTRDPLLNVDIALMPNPTTDRFTLTLEGTPGENLRVELTDLRGIVLENRDINLSSGEARESFDVSGLPSGVYFVKIQGDEGLTSRRIVVSHE